MGSKDANHVAEIRAIEDIYEDMGFERDFEVIKSLY
jgi:hypothetical protein